MHQLAASCFDIILDDLSTTRCLRAPLYQLGKSSFVLWFCVNTRCRSSRAIHTVPFGSSHSQLLLYSVIPLPLLCSIPSVYTSHCSYAYPSDCFPPHTHFLCRPCLHIPICTRYAFGTPALAYASGRGKLLSFRRFLSMRFLPCP